LIIRAFHGPKRIKVHKENTQHIELMGCEIKITSGVASLTRTNEGKQESQIV
jgi:hypothetical protein